MLTAYIANFESAAVERVDRQAPAALVAFVVLVEAVAELPARAEWEATSPAITKN